jgi:hypothetical protein
MRDFVRNYSFEPEAVEVLVRAFDAAWAIAQTHEVMADENREALCLRLAKRIVELAQAGPIDWQILRDGALASLGITRNGEDNANRPRLNQQTGVDRCALTRSAIPR